MITAKFFVSMHKDNCYVPNCDIIQPIQVGALNARKRFSDILHDDTGDNISAKNPMYCELTAQYWAWKNTDYDYYGFFHYRRYLSFNEKMKEEPDNWNIIIKEYLCESTSKQLHFSNNYIDSIKDIVSKYDVLTMIPANLKKNSNLTVYEQYKKDGVKLHIEDLDIVLEIIKEKYPDYYETAEKYINGYNEYVGNIFIMKKNVFFEYSRWLFDILGEFEKRSDMTLYSEEGYRTPGHLGERLFGIYYTWLKEKKNIKSKELQLVYFVNTEKNVELKPAYNSNNIPIAMVSNENYAPFYAAMIQSMIENSTTDYNYDLVFLQRDFKEKTKKLFANMIKDYSNFSIRFCNVGPYFADSQLNASSTIPIETYFKLAIPDLFKNYSKVLYLDGDMIIKHNIADLFNEDIADHLLGAVIDIAAIGVANGFDDSRRKYVVEYMRMKNPLKQFNAGVLLINIKKFRQTFSSNYLLKFAEGSAFQFQDQDVFNVLCEDNVYFFDQTWNYAGDEIQGYRGNIESFAPRKYYMEYKSASKKPKIIHYSGNEKPWYFPQQEWAEEFWNYFSKTPFYYSYLNRRIFEISDHVYMNKRGKNRFDFVPKIKNLSMKFINLLLPYGTNRRESVKKIYKHFLKNR